MNERRSRARLTTERYALLAIALLTATVALPAAATADEGNTVDRGTGTLETGSTAVAVGEAPVDGGPCVVVSTDPPDAGVYLNCPSGSALG